MKKVDERRLVRVLRRGGTVKIGRELISGRFRGESALVSRVSGTSEASGSAPPPDVLRRIRPWVADEAEAASWYRTYPIAELGNVTPRALVETGRSEALFTYLDHIAEGGYA